MEIIRYPAQWGGLPPLAIALGFFDGVHIGHRRLIERMIGEARRRGLSTAIFTFSSEGEGLKRGAVRLYSTEERIRLLAEFGVDYIILSDFSAVAGIGARDFVLRDLCENLGCRLAVAGYNFRFGAGASGDAEALTELMREAGGEAVILPEERFEGGTLSTTVIRAALADGRCELAANMLGQPYHVGAVVEHGRGDGHKFGFPTINTSRKSDVPLPRGVYATVVEVRGKHYTGVTNLGVCPTFEEREEHFETMLLGFDERVYGERVRIYFLSLLRGERVFPSPEELKKQIDLDAARAEEIARSVKWQAIGQG